MAASTAASVLASRPDSARLVFPLVDALTLKRFPVVVRTAQQGEERLQGTEDAVRRGRAEQDVLDDGLQAAQSRSRSSERDDQPN